MTPPQFLDLDVRPIVAAKKPPLSAILEAVSQLGPGQALRLTAPFEPLPLYQVLRNQGFRHEAQTDGAGTWTIIFRRTQ
jgi:uncharacterized protein (DUF2249 family)